MKLKDLVEVKTNNSECVVLKVKDDVRMDLIALGFNGDEELIRLSKGDTNTCTVWDKDGKSYSWHWGLGGYTLVSDSMDRKRKKIVEAIVKDFGIFVGKYV